ncbi:MAG TPA: FAD-dependent oxidoreductase [Thermoanaerobaculia bacterium]|nr:FAD-dependent oxidoreductase [Thermoanaerobaculia bacterium]
MSHRPDVVVVGSGFAGALAARVLARLGRRVWLVERGRHPRFALGESSTPLAALALTRLAERYDLPDLAPLAAYGKWLRAWPHLRRGLKRGFTFFGTQPDERLLVAASPNDELSDTHWLRADLDAFFVDRAEAEGVSFFDRTTIGLIERVGSRIRLRGQREGQPWQAETGFVVDASGPAAVVAKALGAAALASPSRVASGLVFGHFEEVVETGEVARQQGLAVPPGPYPDDRAAVHHLLDVGWAYQLPFDHGVVSAGVVLDHARPATRPRFAQAAQDPAGAWAALLARHPSLAARFGEARAVVGPAFVPRLQHRLSAAAGPGWLALPSTFAFTDPLFSTGIAWSLAGVERLGRLFEAEEVPEKAGLERYGGLLADEADHIDRLVAGAYATFEDFQLFVPFALLYFAAASFGEASRRLLPEAKDWVWEGFLGCQDEVVRGALGEVLARLSGHTGQGHCATDQEAAHFESWMREAIAPRNLAGLADPARGNLYPVDLEALVANAGLLGLTAEEVRAALPRLLR